MKLLKSSVLPAAISLISLLCGAEASAQEKCEGNVVYALPSTVIRLDVEYVCDAYTPGPFAKFAKKYVGADVPAEAKNVYTMTDISMTPCVEADKARIYTAYLGSAAKTPASSQFATLLDKGLIIIPGESDWNADNAYSVKFPTPSAEALDYDCTSLQYSQVNERNIEKKAQETAEMIFKLRRKKIDIVTGETDATFSGEALNASVEEIDALEAKYTALFVGSVVRTVRKISVNIVPSAEDEMYMAFRVSESAGIVSPDKMTGRPIILQIVPEDGVISEPDFKRRGVERLNCRVPAMCAVKLIDGQDVLLQSRIPVYQKGKTFVFELN